MTKYFLISLLAVGVLCSGCDSVKEELGLNRHTPDEFSVMQRAPLEIPTDLSSLPAPNPGAPRPQEVSAVTQAQQVVLGAEKSVADASSKTEDVLLQKAGVADAKPDIRNQLALDAKVQSKDNRAVVKRILNLGDGSSPTTVVDSAAESKRIQDAKKAGQSVTTGETPMIEQ